MESDRRLAKIFEAARGREDVEGDLEPLLASMLSEARAAWSTLAVTDEEFVRYIAARLPEGAAPGLAHLHAADLYLACACAAGRSDAIEAFEHRYVADLIAVLERSGTARAVADEVAQSLRKRLFVADGARAKIVEYGGRGPLGGWLHVVATRAVHDLRRSEATRAAITQGSEAPSSLTAVDPELATIQRRYGPEFESAFRDAFRALTAEERTVFRLYFVDGLNIERIGLALGLSRATIGRRMVDGRAKLLAETLRLLGERLRATDTELESLLDIVRSKLEISLGALIAETPAE